MNAVTHGAFYYLKPHQYPGSVLAFVFITRIFSGIGNTVV